MARRFGPVAEAVAAVVLLGLSVWCWTLGVGSVVAVVPGLSDVHLKTYDGSWLTTACVLFAAAGLLVVDVVRRRREGAART
ncbi:hypothetical protein G4X40_07160 [Rhodococcus sp. D2-41]|uniref:Uncharacterized protein n=1 Tax=Speluncibacter jeojiensis TaxID=2710754 RepID=A0A9X4M4R2_9ACTN|nr:hypothetical protein [Rhodococcus sp. D2-41]MDG3009924.1 hypothetical protein [Rhodococcus sp. D2-41]MDG3017141.1 hypothetical protein [Corynebacteriales bacterium D3-21]